MENNSKFIGKWGFIWVAAGSAIGLGNIWRFPYLAYECGGGAFIFVYFVLMVLCGLALMITDIAIGRKTGKTAVRAFMELSRKHKWIGYLCILSPILISAYYCVIGGWIFKYFTEFATGSGGILTPDFYDSFISCELGGLLNSPVFWFLIFIAVAVFIMSKNINSGLEKVSTLAMPVLLVLLVVIAIYVLTLPGIDEGLRYYLVPEMDKITPKTFLGALGQMFYSLSIATGSLVAYGAYMRKEDDIEKSAMIVSLLDLFVSFFAGLIVVPSVIYGHGVVESGSGLMFQVLPEIFNSMPLGDFIGILFFLLVAIAALTSVFSMLEVSMGLFTEKTNMNRAKAAVAAGLLAIVLGLPSCLGYGPLSFICVDGKHVLEITDILTNTFFMPIVGIITCLFVAYVLKFTPIVEEIKSSSPFRTEKMYIPVIKYVAPVLIATILVSGVLSLTGIYGI